jgi:predicted glycogen debranching enzyme
MLKFTKDKLSIPEIACSYEWIITNGLGGYASSTIISLNTRRYHGLLIASLKPPLRRFLLLSKLEEEIEIENKIYKLGCNRYSPGVIHPEGYKFLYSFHLNYFPTFTYRLENILIEKTIFMKYLENTTVVIYNILTNIPFKMRIFPLINCRDHHSETKENPYFNFSQELIDGQLKIQAYQDAPILYLKNTSGNYVKTGYWYKNFEYEREKERGLPFQEDNYNPGYFEIEINTNTKLGIFASTEFIENISFLNLKNKEEERLKKIESLCETDENFIKTLFLTSSSFIVKREPLSIIAGYHWFSDWGRDAMISLPGICLVTKRFNEAKQILKNFSSFCKNGLIPNCFLEDGTPIYNSVDASLWFFYSVYKYYKYTNDTEFIKEILPILKEIINFYQKGTDFNIYMDRDGLIYSGEPSLQLTWMDAKVGDLVITSRDGKAVEIQALWYNALKIMEEFGEDTSKLTRKLKVNFIRNFWNKEKEYCYDVIKKDIKDDSLRPNQIFTISLPFSLITGEKAKKIVGVIWKNLYTPYGLRSLSPDSPNFKGKYEGNVFERDSAYHQGTVWVWLLGHFITAYLKVNNYSKIAKLIAKNFLKPFRTHISEAGLGTISEIFDGNPPHLPKGCISQSWSVAEILRAYFEDLL